jgi:uncharacterized membrane protein YjfL (UPF0719 family)
MNLTLYKIIKEHKPYTLQDNNRAQTLQFTGQLKGMNLTLYRTIKGHESYTLYDNKRT